MKGICVVVSVNRYVPHDVVDIVVDKEGRREIISTADKKEKKAKSPH